MDTGQLLWAVAETLLVSG